MGTMAQLNVRIDPQLKIAGDATLSRAHITPTQLIRALWLKVAQGAEALDQVLEVLARNPAASSTTNNASFAQVDPFEEKLLSFYRDNGIDLSTCVTPSQDEWEELLLNEWHSTEEGWI